LIYKKESEILHGPSKPRFTLPEPVNGAMVTTYSSRPNRKIQKFNLLAPIPEPTPGRVVINQTGGK
jgi:hypothetical protein